MKAITKSLVCFFALPSVALANQCYESIILEPSPFNGNGGEIIVLTDGTVWKEISYQYLYLYEYQPYVVICPSLGKMVLEDDVFEVIQIK